MSDWSSEYARCVVCPDCAFAFDAIHADTVGGYSCPLCELERERTQNRELRDEQAMRSRIQTALCEDAAIYTPHEALYAASPGQLLDHVHHRIAQIAARAALSTQEADA